MYPPKMYILKLSPYIVPVFGEKAFIEINKVK